MDDISIVLRNSPGGLALLGETLGSAGVSVEGGGAWTVDGQGTAHFLVADGARAERALTKAGIRVVARRETVTVRLHQAVPGQLGKICRRMADAGVNIEVLYSDHDHQLILVANPIEQARQIAEAWMQERAGQGSVTHLSTNP